MQYPASISSEELSQLESVDFDGPIVVVSDLDEDFAEAMDYLKGQTVIGFDTETKPSFTSNSPRHHVALLQLSGRDKAYVFRLNLMGLPAPLAIILGKKVSKTQQLSNWEAPQLSGAQLKYAAIDAWVCREMYIRLKTEGK